MMAIVEGVKLPWLKANELESGVEVEIKSPPERTGTYLKFSCIVETEQGQFMMGFNDSSVGYMVSSWGNDSSTWVGSRLQLTKEKRGRFEDVPIWRPV